MKPDIWIICIAYDYGIVGRAGWLGSEEEANEWIAGERKKNEYYVVEWYERQRRDYPDEEPEEYPHTPYYAARIEHSSKKLLDTATTTS